MKTWKEYNKIQQEGIIELENKLGNYINNSKKQNIPEQEMIDNVLINGHGVLDI